jgi:leader peptidase (prepilin peptidase) / N-methyltransferase
MSLHPNLAEFEYYLLFVILFPALVLDIKYKQIPGMLVSAAIVVFILLGVIQDKVPDYLVYVNCFIGYTYVYVLFVISKGKIGLGDAKLSALIALALGLKLWVWALMFASMFGIIYGAIFIKLKILTVNSKIPFAPFLSLGCYLSLFLIK